jgi:hypothetical protein
MVKKMQVEGQVTLSSLVEKAKSDEEWIKADLSIRKKACGIPFLKIRFMHHLNDLYELAGLFRVELAGYAQVRPGKDVEEAQNCVDEILVNLDRMTRLEVGD